MNSDKEQADLFTRVNPLAVQTYLLRTGWREKEVVAERHIILSNSKGSRNFLIFLPLDKDIPDFSSRMVKLFNTLEAFGEKQKLRMTAEFIDTKVL